MPLIDPTERQGRYSLGPVPSQELPEQDCMQLQTAYGTSAPDFSSRFTPEVFYQKRRGHKAAEFSFSA